MSILEKIRLLIALLVCPLLMGMVMRLAFELAVGEDAVATSAIQSSIATAFWLVVVSTVVLSIPIVFLLRRKGYESVLSHMLAGSLMGILVWLLFSVVSDNMVAVLFYMFIVAGGVQGLIYHAIVYYQPAFMQNSVARRGVRKRRY